MGVVRMLVEDKNVVSYVVFSSIYVNYHLSVFPPQIKNTMVIGIDSYHDTAQKGRSAVGFCASMNPTLTRSVG